MSDAEVIPLAEGFEPASHEAWMRLVEKTLKGAAFETLRSRTADGLVIEPLYMGGEPSPVRPRFSGPDGTLRQPARVQGRLVWQRQATRSSFGSAIGLQPRVVGDAHHSARPVLWPPRGRRHIKTRMQTRQSVVRRTP